MTDRDDDLDWLYRRGRYGEDAPDRTRAMPAGEQRPASRPEPTPVARDREAAPAAFDQRPRPDSTPLGTPGKGARGGQAYASVPAGPGGAGRAQVKRPRKRHIGRWILLALVLWVAYLIVVPIITWGQLSKVDATPAGDRPAQQPGDLYVLAGSDSREGLSSEERRKLGTGSTEGKRTDTIMMLYIPPSGQPALISLPRDSFVKIPGHGRNKINASYALGGPKLLVQTIEQNTGLRVDGYAEVGFGGFVDIIDAVGGIEMCLDRPINDKDSHLNLPAGCQNLNGVNALGYVRMRKADPRGDLGRVERQRAMIAAVAKKAASPWSVINPVQYWALNSAGSRALTTGEGTSMTDVARLGSAFYNVSRGNGLTLTVPTGAPVTTSAGSSLIWDKQESRAMFQAIANGDTSSLAKYKK
ncbi:LCP family glycopolymer transferase [Nigerium massiliense]|uniref:LCP family glycopolymer transferase n=1 Tax=Nigerium massiliense TaxID=1522317 RepID=UPI000B1D61A9|nr:LCP family protein [Nigerium massiliense]